MAEHSTKKTSSGSRGDDESIKSKYLHSNFKKYVENSYNLVNITYFLLN